MTIYAGTSYGRSRNTYKDRTGEEKDGEDDIDMNNDKENCNGKERENNNEETKSRKRGREKGWIETKNHENIDLPDHESLPALLYQLTSVMRKCGGVSVRLRALVLNAVSEVSDV